MRSHFTVRFLEEQSLLEIDGWCWDPDAARNTITVDLYCEGVLLGSKKASQFRQDLVYAGIGDGYQAFNFLIKSES